MKTSLYIQVSLFQLNGHYYTLFVHVWVAHNCVQVSVHSQIHTHKHTHLTFRPNIRASFFLLLSFLAQAKMQFCSTVVAATSMPKNLNISIIWYLCMRPRAHRQRRRRRRCGRRSISPGPSLSAETLPVCVCVVCCVACVRLQCEFIF